jgi:hypothetical protein
MKFPKLFAVVIIPSGWTMMVDFGAGAGTTKETSGSEIP